MKAFSPAFLLGFTLALMSLQQASALDAEPKLVPALDKVVIKNVKGKMVLSAKGEVPTGGYTKPRLVRAAYIQAPPDGVQDVFFLVTPPPLDAFVTQAIEPVSAELVLGELKGDAPWLTGVRVHGGDGKSVLVKVDCDCES